MIQMRMVTRSKVQLKITVKLLLSILNRKRQKNSSNKISNEFKDFIIKCLDPNPIKRPTAIELVNHPFIKKNLNEININNFSNLFKNNVEKIENYKNNKININMINITKNSINLSNINNTNNTNNTNNSFDNKSNIDKLAEFRIEEMKKNEIIECFYNY